jgi:hypothetical protein
MTSAGAWSVRAVVLAIGASALVVLAPSCGGDATGTTGVRLSIVSEDVIPEVITVSWFHGAQLVFERRAPSTGTLAPDSAARVLVIIDVAPDAAGTRRVVARGLISERPVSEGAGRVEVVAGQWQELTVRLTSGRLPDRDADGLPDDIDDCPANPDPACRTADGGLPDGARVPGGPDAAGGSDAAAPPGATGASDTAAPPGATGGGDAASTGADRPSRGPEGQSCASAADCLSGFCADGVCCASACREPCQACNLPGSAGRCAPAPAGQDPRDDCAPEAPATCGRDGLCDGNGRCRLHPAGTVCEASRCAGGMETAARTCTGQGACGPATTRRCAPYACAGAACGASCLDATGCAPEATCSGGKCVDPLAAGLVGHWKLDEGQGLGASDASGTGNGGTLGGGARWTPSSAPVPGGSTSALEFDGVDDHVMIPDAATLRPSMLTVATWVYFNTVGPSLGCGGRPAFANNQFLVFKRSPRFDNFEGYTLLLSSGTLRFALTNASATAHGAAIAPTPASAGLWYHVAGTFDGATIKLYVNGELQAMAAHPHPVAHGTRPLFLGRSGECGGPGEATWDSFLAGRLDDVRIYNRALSAAEVKALSGR